MKSSEKFELRKKVSENVFNNINVINELLTNPPQSDIVEKAEELSLLCKSNSEDFVHNEPSDEYYNLKTIEKLASLMEIEKISFDDKDSKKNHRHRLNSDRAGSRTSLASFPSMEDFNTASNEELLNEIQSSIDNMKENLARTSHEPLNIDFLHEMKSKDFRKKAKLIGFVANLKRLQNELEKIALSDNVKSAGVADDFEIDDSTIDDLRTLNKVKSLSRDLSKYFTLINFHFQPTQKLADMKMLQKKPAEEQEKPEPVNFTASCHIDTLLELMGRILA